MSGQLLVAAARRARRDAPARPVQLRRRRPRAAVRRPAHLRRPGARGPGGGRRPGGVPASVAHIARDPLDPAFDDDGVRAPRCAAGAPGSSARCSTRRWSSGVGNIYADEALWRARLHGARPDRRADPRPGAPPARRTPATCMAEALAQGGTSFDALYVDVNGAERLLRPLAGRYGQEGRPCPRCGTPIRREAFMNRSSLLLPALPAAAASAAARERGAAVAVVSGQVQGVGYRWWVRALASASRAGGSAAQPARRPGRGGGSRAAATPWPAAGRARGPRAARRVTRVDVRGRGGPGQLGVTTASTKRHSLDTGSRHSVALTALRAVSPWRYRSRADRAAGAPGSPSGQSERPLHHGQGSVRSRRRPPAVAPSTSRRTPSCGRTRAPRSSASSTNCGRRAPERRRSPTTCCRWPATTADAALARSTEGAPA